MLCQEVGILAEKQKINLSFYEIFSSFKGRGYLETSWWATAAAGLNIHC